MSPESDDHQTLDLPEHTLLELPREVLLDAEGQVLWERYRKQVDVAFPTPKTKQRWRLKSSGWVGHVPISETLSLRLLPKVPLDNIFRMLETAHDLASLRILDERLDECDSLVEFFERLAEILAARTARRIERGLHRDYQGRRERLETVRGRIDMKRTAAAPWRVRLDCRFEESTVDVENNQILLWTLDRIARSSACRRGDVLREVRRTRDRLLGGVTLRPFGPESCMGRTYTHLDEDYRPLHALCRFFLEHTGPAHRAGRHRNLPFLVHMDHLFEVYVHRWLRAHLPAHLRLRDQDRLHLGTNQELLLKIDMVLSLREDDRTIAVLDTKYTVPKRERPANSEIYQMVTYATAKGCREAFLIYPVRLERPFDIEIGDVRVRALGLDLGADDLDRAGEELLTTVLAEVERDVRDIEATDAA